MIEPCFVALVQQRLRHGEWSSLEEASISDLVLTLSRAAHIVSPYNRNRRQDLDQLLADSGAVSVAELLVNRPDVLTLFQLELAPALQIRVAPDGVPLGTGRPGPDSRAPMGPFAPDWAPRTRTWVPGLVDEDWYWNQQSIPPGPLKVWRIGFEEPVTSVYEIESARDWCDLCDAHPRITYSDEVADSGSSFPPPHPNVFPDWPQVAERYDSVHVTWFGAMDLGSRILRCEKGWTTWFGWGGEGTIWFRRPARCEPYDPAEDRDGLAVALEERIGRRPPR